MSSTPPSDDPVRERRKRLLGRALIIAFALLALVQIVPALVNGLRHH